MKTKRSGSPWLFIGIIVVILLISFFMPRLVAMITDYHLKSEVHQASNKNISLRLGDKDGVDYRYLFSKFSLRHSLRGAVGSAAMEEATVRERVEQTLTGLGLDAGRHPISSVAPKLLVNTVGERYAAIFWECDLTAGSQREEKIWIDDRTGLVMYFELYFDDTSALEQTLRQYCREQYPAETVAVRSGSANLFWLDLTFADGTCTLTTRVNKGLVIFNYLQ